VNRREFARAAAILTAGTLSGTAFAGPWCKDLDLPMHLVYDARIIEAREAFAAATVNIAKAHGFTSDLTPIWFDELHGLWESGCITTMGFTRDAEFFVLSTLARDQGYAVAGKEVYGGKVSWLLVPDIDRRRMRR
jgi:hypothetical protein